MRSMLKGERKQLAILEEGANLCSVAAAIVGSAAVGAVASSAASSRAANAQEAAARDANATSMAQYDQTRQDQMPWMNRGNAAGNKLSFLLGTGGTPESGGVFTANDLIDTSQGDWKPNATLYANSPEYKAAWDKFYADHQARFGVAPNLARGSGLQVVQDYLQQNFDLNAYNQARQQQAQSAQNDPAYGSLLRNFTQADLENDPIYKNTLDFTLSEGTKNLQRQAAAGGNLLSGATQKALAKYTTGVVNQLGGDAYNRFNNNKQTNYNMLAGVAGTGQTAVGQVDAAGQNTANNVSQNQLAIGNSRAASAIGGANALNSGISTAFNGYTTNRALDLYQQRVNGGRNTNALYSGVGGRLTQWNDMYGNGGWGTGNDFGNEDYGVNF